MKNNAFLNMKKVVGHDVLPYYPNLSEKFIIHTGSSKTQLGGVIRKMGNPSLFIHAN